jgi:hypothetical protein
MLFKDLEGNDGSIFAEGEDDGKYIEEDERPADFPWEMLTPG